MLRRTKTIVFDDEPDTQNDNEPSVLRKAARRGLDVGRTGLRTGPTLTPREAEILPQREFVTEDEPRANPVHERVDFLRSEFENEPISRGSQESLAALRAEFRRKHVENGDDGSTGPSLPSFSLGGLRPSRLILVAVALIAGGIAAWLAVGRQPEVIITAPAVVQQVAPATPPPAAATVEILVAKAPIPVGTRLTPDLLEWQKWPEETVRTEYVTSAATPEAMTDLAGSVVRLEILSGEPIRREKLGQAGAGYLSAILEAGKRAVSVSIDAKSASGGFIMPNDHVDVVLTTRTETDQVSRTILTNVRVLAVNSKLGASEQEAATASPEEGMFADAALATLELDPAQAELIINAATSGDLSLVLRPTADVSETINAAQQAINQSIRMTSPFWLAPGANN